MKQVSERDGGGGPSRREEKVPFFKLFSFADGWDIVMMIIGTLAAIGAGISMPLMTAIFGQVINSFASSHSTDVVAEVSAVIMKYVYLAIYSGILSFIQVSSWMITGERQAARIRGLYLKAILRQDIVFFDKETTTGEVIGRMSGDTILIQAAMGEKVGKFIQLISTFCGGLVIAFIKGWQLALVVMACLPLLVLVGSTTSVVMSKMMSRGQKAYEEAGNVVEQAVGSIRTVVSFTGEKKSIGKYNESLKTSYTTTVQQGIASGSGIGAVLLILFGSYGLAVWSGSRLIIEKGYNGGTVINVVIAMMTGGMSLGQASPSVNAFTAGQAAAYKMFETLLRKPEIDASDTSGIVLEDIKGDIELRNVSFSYPARPEIQVFLGFSLNVPSGTTAALVGESGSGKSTVISLVERFYDPQDGEVLIDGINLKKLRLGWIREKIGLVSQEPILFMTTIKENIVYGKVGATLEEIRRATELANAAKFIDKLPQGLDTMVGEHGTQLSGGQKQRIAIARAILKNPKILLLDEATSALDAESEHIVQDALQRVMLNRTTIVVAHRLSTIRNADTIAVVHGGKIVEQGCHSDLIKDPEGAYSQLIHLQEVNKQDEEVSSMEIGPAKTSFDTSQAMSSSVFHGILPRRSTSKGSSGENISRSTSMNVGVSSLKDVHVRDEGKKQCDGNVGKPKNISIGRLAYLNKPELPVLLFGSIAASVHGVIFPVFGILLSSAIKIFFEPPHELRKDSWHWALWFLGLGLVSLVVVPFQYYLFGVAGGKLIQRIRSSSFERVLHQEISWFDEPMNSSGAIGARLSANASAVRGLVGDFLALVVQNTSTVIAAVIIAFVANWKLALIILATVPLLGFQGYCQMKFLWGFSGNAQVMYEEASQVANDAVSSIRTVASFCAEQKVIDIYEKKCEAPVKKSCRQGIVSGGFYGFSFFVLYCTYALIFYVGAHFVEDGSATSNQVFRAFLALTMAALGISQSSAMGPDVSKCKDAAASIFGILDRKSKIDSSKDEGMTLPHVKGDIEFQNVNFKYPTRPDVQIFRDLCLSIPSGKTVALVGESGSGKSTVIALLERFYDPDSGQILLDGVEIQKFKLNWLRQQMGLVSQEPILFNDTIRANIAYGKQGEVSEDDLIAVTEASNAHHFISALPHGYDTCVGERGVQLSGGQKQRIAIARAILKDPKILLLDEATSALDAESEHVVQEALDRVMRNRSTIVVAHRLSTIYGADVIAVVKNGVIAEKGRHETLMKITDGAYASLAAFHTSSSK